MQKLPVSQLDTIVAKLIVAGMIDVAVIQSQVNNQLQGKYKPVTTNDIGFCQSWKDHLNTQADLYYKTGTDFTPSKLPWPPKDLLNREIETLLNLLQGQRQCKKITEMLNEQFKGQFREIKKGMVSKSAIWKQYHFRRVKVRGDYYGRVMEQVIQRPERLADFVDLFLTALRGKSANTVLTYDRCLRDFLNDMPEQLDEVTILIIESYLIRKRTTNKASTLNLHINCLKSFFRWLGKYGYADLGKLIAIVPALPPEQRILTAHEYQLISERTSGHVRDCFQFLCNTGLRATEFVQLGRDNVCKGFLRVNGKGRRNRSIPLNQAATEILQRNPNFEMIKRRNRLWVFRMLKQISRDVGVPEFHPHSCRHFFANELYHRGTDMFMVSRLLGHATTTVTEQVYVHWSEESLQGMTAALDNIGCKSANNKTLKIVDYRNAV